MIIGAGLTGSRKFVLATCGQCGFSDAYCVCYTHEHESYVTSYSTMRPLFKNRYGYSLVRQAAAFYGAMALAQMTNDMSVARPIIKEVADSLARAATISVLGESRYHALCAFHEILVRSKLSELYYEGRAYASPLGRYAQRDIDYGGTVTHSSGLTRESVSVSMLNMDSTPEEWRDAARLARTVFGLHIRLATSESDSIGGVTWYTGADLTWKYLAGRISATVYCDSVFGLTHNSGPLLNKTHTTQGIKAFLDYRRSASIEDLARLAPYNVRLSFSTLLPNPEEWRYPNIPPQAVLAGVSPSAWLDSAGHVELPPWQGRTGYGLGTADYIYSEDYARANVFSDGGYNKLLKSNLSVELERFDSGPWFETNRPSHSDKTDQVEVFFKTRTNKQSRPTLRMLGHNCSLCDGVDMHPHYMLCSLGTPQCTHDTVEGACCCSSVKFVLGQKGVHKKTHNVSCENYTQCPVVEGCPCAYYANACCHYGYLRKFEQLHFVKGTTPKTRHDDNCKYVDGKVRTLKKKSAVSAPAEKEAEVAVE